MYPTFILTYTTATPPPHAHSINTHSTRANKHNKHSKYQAAGNMIYSNRLLLVSGSIISVCRTEGFSLRGTMSSVDDERLTAIEAARHLRSGHVVLPPHAGPHNGMVDDELHEAERQLRLGRVPPPPHRARPHNGMVDEELNEAKRQLRSGGVFLPLPCWPPQWHG